MKTARQVMDLCAGGAGPSGLRELERLVAVLPVDPFTPKSRRTPPTRVSLRTVLESASFSAIEPAPLTVICQNLALLPGISIPAIPPSPPSPLGDEPKDLYKGADRGAVVTTLISTLRAEHPDVVGLSEAWVKAERDRLRDELKDLYPYVAEGTGMRAAVSPLDGALNSFGVAEAIVDLDMDVELMLLSRHPIVEVHASVFPHACGEDGLASKGVLHVRLAINGSENHHYDMFLTHLQSPSPEVNESILTAGQGRTDAPEETVLWQLTHLASFVHAHRSPERPALLMGDLNVHAHLRERMMHILAGNTHIHGPVSGQDRYPVQYPIDLWVFVGRPPESEGFTLQDSNNFNKYNDKPSNDRVDYLLAWPGSRLWPVYDYVEVIRWKTPAGKDISDHYGLRLRQTHIRERELDRSRAIQKLTVKLHRVHCMKVTQWNDLIDRDDRDEVHFKLSCTTARSEHQWRRESVRHTNVHSGWAGELVPVLGSAVGPLVVTISDPGEWLEIKGEGWEDDGISESSLGAGVLRLSRDELLRQGPAPNERVLPLLMGDGGEYALSVTVTVE